VYISIDDSRTVQNWKNYMVHENVPWRSLIAVDNINEVRNKYFVESIPYSLFVYPNGKMERLDVSKEEGRTRIYEIVRREQ
jgi:hypothetical protein